MFKTIAALAAAVVGLSMGSAGAAGFVTYHLEAPSPTLGHPIPYAVYTPFASPAEGERWPVVYLLHGTSGKDGDWFTWGNLGPILDDALATGRIPPMIVVAPGMDDSWYVDDPDPGSFGLVDSAIVNDLIPAIDKSLPTAHCRAGRAIGGVSMGGAGAILQAINHPDTYAAAMSFSGALHQPIVKGDVRMGWLPSLYSGIFGSPFSVPRFNAANAFNRVIKLQGLAVKPAFYLTIGDQDFPDLIEASAIFHNRLHAVGADSTLRMGPGRHFWDTWQQAIIPALEWLAPKLDAKCGRI